MSIKYFHPATKHLFAPIIQHATETQKQTWQALHENKHTLIVAPTGSGKTLAVFLSIMDRLLRLNIDSTASNNLENQTYILYITPRQSLSDEGYKNLFAPLEQICTSLQEDKDVKTNIRIATQVSNTQEQNKDIPHILLLTPESLYESLNSRSGRKMLSTVHTVIVDELHTIAGNKRGAHLTLSLERLSALCDKAPSRIGLSASHSPLHELALFLIGTSEEDIDIIDTDHIKEGDFNVDIIASPLATNNYDEMWREIFRDVSQQILEHRSTLVFVDSSKTATHVANKLIEILGGDQVAAYHDSISIKSLREIKQRFIDGDLKAMIVTEVPDTGIETYQIDMICQLGSPHSISSFTEHTGRTALSFKSGEEHSPASIAKIPTRLYPVSHNDLIESIAILDAIKNDELDRIEIPEAPLDILAQQISAELSFDQWDEHELFHCITKSRPFQDLTRSIYTQVVDVLKNNFKSKNISTAAQIHYSKIPTRSGTLSKALSRTHQLIHFQLERGIEHTTTWIMDQYSTSLVAASQASEYIASIKATFDCIPDQTTLIYETFNDSLKGSTLAIHSVNGSRINRALGVALQHYFQDQIFCEPEITVTEDCCLLSWDTNQVIAQDISIKELKSFLTPESIHTIVNQAILESPLFKTHWRYACINSLAVPYYSHNKNGAKNVNDNTIAKLLKTLPQDHPLITQTINDCTRTEMDIDGLYNLLQFITDKKIKVIHKKLNGPSCITIETQDRVNLTSDTSQTLADQNTSTPQTNSTSEPIWNQDAIDKVRLEAWPDIQSPDDLHDAMMVLGFITEQEGMQLGDSWNQHLEVLLEQQRCCSFTTQHHRILWIARERLTEFKAVYPQVDPRPNIGPLKQHDRQTKIDHSLALQNILRSRFEGIGPSTVASLNQTLSLKEAQLESAIKTLEQEGFVISGRFSKETQQSNSHELEWCERGLLSRIESYSKTRSINPITPVSAQTFMRFLFSWHHINIPRDDDNALNRVLFQLEGVPLSASDWEKHILPARIEHYSKDMLDRLCISGAFAWQHNNSDININKAINNTLVSILPRNSQHHWGISQPPTKEMTKGLTTEAKKVFAILKQLGASFFNDICQLTKLPETLVENALRLLVTHKLVSADSFNGLRILHNTKYSSSIDHDSIAETGRWSIISPLSTDTDNKISHIATTLLKRYGVVFRKLLDKEENLPPWRDLLYVYRRMEGQGKILGGRYIENVSGEQFALPEAIALLQTNIIEPNKRDYVSINAADPLNLTTVMPDHSRISSASGDTLLFRDGELIATSTSNEVVFLQEVDSVDEWEIRNIFIKNDKTISHHSDQMYYASSTSVII